MVHTKLISIVIDNNMLLHISIIWSKNPNANFVIKETSPYPHLSMGIYKIQQYTCQTLHTSRLRCRYESFESEQTISFIYFKIKCSINRNKRVGLENTPMWDSTDRKCSTQSSSMNLDAKAPDAKSKPHFPNDVTEKLACNLGNGD